MKTGGPHLIIYRQTTLICKRDLQHKAVIVEGVMAVDGGDRASKIFPFCITMRQKCIYDSPSVDD
jgi:hypothetical protein